MAYDVSLIAILVLYVRKSLNKRLTSGGYTLARGCICPHTDCSLFCICLAMVVNVHLHLLASACIHAQLGPCVLMHYLHQHVSVCAEHVCLRSHTHLHQCVWVASVALFPGAQKNERGAPGIHHSYMQRLSGEL